MQSRFAFDRPVRRLPRAWALSLMAIVSLLLWAALVMLAMYLFR